MSEVKNVHQPEGFRLVSRLKSFGHAGQGIAFMLRTQHNAWLHVLISVIVIALALYCGVDAGDWRSLVMAMTIVWVSESVNTAVE